MDRHFPRPKDMSGMSKEEIELTEREIDALLARYRLNYENKRATSRLALPTQTRIPIATGISFLGGLGLGMAHGAKRAALLYRAENSHRLPTTPTGWYLYHKSKNYKVAWAALGEGAKLGTKFGSWTLGYFYLEDTLDEFWGRKDFLNSVVASLVVAGSFSLWNKFDVITSVRTAKKGLGFGLAFGLTQDALGYARGRPIWYADWITGRRRRYQEELEMDAT